METQKVNLRRIFTYTAILFLIIYFSFSWTTMIGNQNERTGSDFMGFYIYGRVPQKLNFADIYKIEVQQQIEEQIVGHSVIPIFYTHLPFIAPLAMVLVDESYVDSFKRWALVLLFINALSVYLLANLLDVQKFSKANLIVLCAGAFLFDPTFSGFMNGQDTAILLLGAAIWARGYFSGNLFLSGLGLSLTTIRPQIALFLAIPFFFQHRKVFWGFVVGSSALALLSIGLLGMDGTLRFIESIRYIEGTIWHQAHALDMPTISGIIRRNFEVTNAGFVKNFVWLCYILGIVGFSFLWGRSAKIDERHIGLLTLFSIFLLPYAHYHELTLLLIPIFCLLRIYQREGVVPENYLSIIPLLVSCLSLSGFLGSGALKFPIINTVMFLLGYLILKSNKLSPSSSALSA